ncbi:hypothetical protein F66182_2101 [Fusarium sp. NRRL 66182]|nr:hypothetical protein F66182_2101 [Fusarium sp. NRRL 66182]
MVRFTPFAVLALVPLAQARFNWLHARDTIAECPPCSANDEPKTFFHTVTVTEPSRPYETVTLREPGEPGKPVTVTKNYQHPQTKVVYISQGETIDPPKETVTVTETGRTVTVTETAISEHVVTKGGSVYPDPGHSSGSGPKTITISHDHPAPTANYDRGVVTKVVGSAGENGEYPGNIRTVTVVDDGEIKTLTYDNGHENTIVKTITQDNGQEKVVTLTDSSEHEVVKTVTVDDGSKKVIKTITIEDTINRVVTKTIRKDGKYHTVVIKPEPTASTITNDYGDYITTIIDVLHTYTLTAPAHYATADVADDDCETFTRTATYAGKPEVEVVVCDPETGDSTCTRKEDGRPCHTGYHNNKTGYGDYGSHTGGHDNKGQYADPSYTKAHGSNGSRYTGIPVYTRIRTYGNGDAYTEVYGDEETACDAFAISTSIATVYNTVVVTVGVSSNEDASPSSTPTAKRRAANKARSLLSVQW